MTILIESKTEYEIVWRFEPKITDKFAELCNNDFFKQSLNQAINNANTEKKIIVQNLFRRYDDRNINEWLDKIATKILDCLKEYKENKFYLDESPMAENDMIKFLKQYKAESPNDFKNVILNTSFFDDYNRTLDTGKEIYITLPFNELLTEINKGTIKDDENLCNYYLKHFNKQNPQQKLGDFKDFEKDLLAINKQITYYESKKSVLLAEAKERIPKEILAKLDKLSEKISKNTITNQQIETYLTQKPQIAQNILKFRQNYQTQHQHQR